MTKFIHGHTRDGQRFTAAYDNSGETIQIAVSLCSKRDQFNKKIGRLISEGRLNKTDKILTIPKAPEGEFEDTYVRDTLEYNSSNLYKNIL